MLQAMFSGVSGLQAQQTKMNTIGNNISNLNTVGFKSQVVTFQDQLSQTLQSAAGPTSTTGGTNPSQVGLGVKVGAISTIETQGNLQTTGKATDMAIQGSGFFVVSDNGKNTLYTRDGTFDLDSSGTLVNPSTGARLLGYKADKFGVVDTSAPITPASTLQIPIGALTDAKQTDNIATTGNLDASSALYSTKVDYAGNLDFGAAANAQLQTTTTVYDNLGNAHTVQMTLSNPVANPSGAGVPAGVTQAWTAVVKVDGGVVYDSSAGKSALYRVGGSWQFADTTTGATLGSSIALDGVAGSNHAGQISGATGANNISLSLNLGSLTNNAATGTLSGTGDGQTGSSPYWGTSIQVYDSLGVAHIVTFKYTHAQLGAGAPAGATGRWDWIATENGVQVADSTQAGNSPLYFGNTGRLVGGASQSITVTPNDGSISPFTIKVNNEEMTQLSSDANASASSQDGYPVGTLQSYNIAADGLITGIFSSGQSRALGQVAMATFSNPAGLEKVGGNLLRNTDNSGTPSIGQAGQGGRGKLNPGFVEMSNVDLSTEFTNLIVTQRGFQANTRIVTAVDELLQDVLNLKR